MVNEKVIIGGIYILKNKKSILYAVITEKEHESYNDPYPYKAEIYTTLANAKECRACVNSSALLDYNVYGGCRQSDSLGHLNLAKLVEIKKESREKLKLTL